MGDGITDAPAPICVKHRTGWCATRRHNLPMDTVDNQSTLCRHYVTLPWGFERRRPTCPDCLKVLERRNQR